ncbi:MAG TPA: hypothetical protein VG944_20530 [Fimbriimonas sp.]|nr:hypothetical protein [Fimbriimonas sp.]
MTTSTLIRTLAWCAGINYAILILWMLATRTVMFPMWQRMFKVSESDANRLNLLGIMLYKIGIFLFNLVPLVALLIVTR